MPTRSPGRVRIPMDEHHPTYHAGMRIGRSRDCGELLIFEEVRRRLNLGMPQFESETTIAVAVWLISRSPTRPVPPR